VWSVHTKNVSVQLQISYNYRQKMAPSLPKIQDEDRESKYGYVFAVSGPGELTMPFVVCTKSLFWGVL
jgi:hypothetical protein